MLIIVGLILLGLVVGIGLLAGLVGSLVLGGVLTGFARTRPVAPILVCVVPITMGGALAGGLGLGYLALHVNESAVFLAAGAGLVLGAILGFGIRILAATIWWWRRRRESTSSGLA